MIDVTLLGPPRVEVDGIVRPGLSAGRAAVLLGYLVTHPGLHARAALARRLWPEYDDRAARAALSRAVYRLRDGLGPVLVADRQQVGIPDGMVRSDVTVLRRSPAASTDAELAAAVDGWGGDFLADVIGGEPEIEELLDRFRRDYRDRRTEAIAELVARLEDSDDLTATLERARQWVAISPYDERAHRAVMRTLAGLGRLPAVREHHHRLIRMLDDELGVAPETATDVLVEQLEEDAILATARPAAPPLPALLSRTLGRERELGQLLAALAGGHRLITLTGLGGVGKTRLALEFAHRAARDGLVDRVHLSELAALRDPELAAYALAQAVGAAASVDALDAVVHRLAGSRVLLVLDNVEQLDGARGLVSDLLARLPEVVLLLTSRGPCGLRDELLLPVRPLSPDVARLLFVERSRAARPDVVATAADVAIVCDLLEGLPLALELAAAQLRLMGLPALVRRLRSPRPLDAPAPNDRPERHRSIASLVDWSYRLLDPDDQRAFRLLGVFRGGISEHTFAAVCGSAEPVLPQLVRLVDAGLLAVEDARTAGPSGEPRFRTLRTVWETAERLLEQAGEREQAQERHGAVFLTLAQGAAMLGLDAEDRDQIDRLDALEIELDDVRAAMDRAHVRRDGSALAAWCAALLTLWLRTPLYDEGWRRVQQALDCVLEPAVEGRLRADAALLSMNLQRESEAIAHLDRSLVLLPAMSETWGAPRYALARAVVSLVTGSPADALAYAETALADALEQGDAWTALAVLFHSLHLHEMLGDPAAARRANARAGEVIRQHHAWLWWPLHLNAGGHQLALDGQPRAGAALIADAFSANLIARYFTVSKYTLLEAVMVGGDTGDLELAAQLVGVADSRYRTTPSDQWLPWVVPRWQALLRRLETALTPARLTALRTHGATLDDHGVLALLRELADPGRDV